MISRWEKRWNVFEKHVFQTYLNYDLLFCYSCSHFFSCFLSFFFFSLRCLCHFIRESKHLIYALSLTVRLLKLLAKMTSKSISRVLIFLFCVKRAIAIPRDNVWIFNERLYFVFSVWLVSSFFFYSYLFRGVFVFQE